MGSFCTAVNCMDGRIQLPVIRYLQKRFGAEYVDMITETGPNGILSRGRPGEVLDSIHQRIDISVNVHGSKSLAVVGHYDCAGNPGNKAHQIADVQTSIGILKSSYADLEIIGLWVDENWTVSEVS